MPFRTMISGRLEPISRMSGMGPSGSALGGVAGEGCGKLVEVIFEMTRDHPLGDLRDGHLASRRVEASPVAGGLIQLGPPPAPAFDPGGDPRFKLGDRQGPVPADDGDPAFVGGDPPERFGARLRGDDPLDLAEPIGEHLHEVGQDLGRAPGRLRSVIEALGKGPRTAGSQCRCQALEAGFGSHQSTVDLVVVHESQFGTRAWDRGATAAASTAPPSFILRFGILGRVTTDPLAIEPMTADDWPDVRRIYTEGIETGGATLEREAPDWDHFDRSHPAECRLVARDRDAGAIVGWTALGGYSARKVYSGVAWESVYVGADARGRGVGRALLEALIEASEAAGYWTLFAGVLAENAGSLALHERVGFRRIGVQRRLGQDALGRWRDVVLLERRSRVVGLD